MGSRCRRPAPRKLRIGLEAGPVTIRAEGKRRGRRVCGCLLGRSRLRKCRERSANSCMKVIWLIGKTTAVLARGIAAPISEGSGQKKVVKWNALFFPPVWLPRPDARAGFWEPPSTTGNIPSHNIRSMGRPGKQRPPSIIRGPPKRPAGMPANSNHYFDR